MKKQYFQKLMNATPTRAYMVHAPMVLTIIIVLVAKDTKGKIVVMVSVFSEIKINILRVLIADDKSS